MPALSPTDAVLVMNDVYDTQFGFHNQMTKDTSRPMSSVAIFPNETNGYNSNMYALFEKYHESKVLKYFGLNLLEFINNPREQIEWMFKLCEQFIRADFKRDQAAIDSFNEGQGSK